MVLLTSWVQNEEELSVYVNADLATLLECAVFFP